MAVVRLSVKACCCFLWSVGKSGAVALAMTWWSPRSPWDVWWTVSVGERGDQMVASASFLSCGKLVSSGQLVPHVPLRSLGYSRIGDSSVATDFGLII